MAEHFEGRTHAVHFSNGAAAELLRAWLANGEGLEPTADHLAVLAFLRDRLHGRPDGFRSFPLAPPPAELAAPPRLRCLARLIAACAHDLAAGRPDPTLDVHWDRDLHLSWLARLLDLYGLLNEALPAGAAPLPPLAPDLPPADRRRCEFYRLLFRKAELARRRPADRPALLALLDEMLALVGQEEPSPGRARVLAAHHQERADLLLRSGEGRAAVAALRAAAAEEPDAEARQALEEYAALLSQET